MPRINLLPWREAERKRRQREFAAMAIAGVVFALIVGVGVHWQISQWISTQKARNALLNKEIKALDKQIAQIKELEKTKESLISRMEIIQDLQRSRPSIVHLFDELVKTIPGGVYLTSLEQKGKTIVVKGKAQSNARVSSFMHNIENSDWIGNPTLLLIDNQDKGRRRNTRSPVEMIGLSYFELQFQQKTPKQQSEEETS